MKCRLDLSLSHRNALLSSFEEGDLCDSGLDPNAGAKSTGLAIGRRQVAGGREGSNFMLPHHKPTRRYGRDDGFADRCPCVSSTPPPALPVLISCVVLCDLRVESPPRIGKQPSPIDQDGRQQGLPGQHHCSRQHRCRQVSLRFLLTASFFLAPLPSSFSHFTPALPS